MRCTLKVSSGKVLGIVCLFLATLLFAPISWAEESIIAPVPGKVTLVDLGAKKCIPCKMMAPILEALEKEYQDRAAIVFIDVWENQQAARTFGIKVIPTQIFYDAEGKEMHRHEGYMARDAIIAELTKLGVQ